MNSVMSNRLSSPQQTALVILRTLIGWHFLYEGYYKLLSPAWSAEGKPLPPWSSAGYLKAATGPLARMFQWLIDAGWVGRIDTMVKIGLLLVGLSLILVLLTRVGCWGALFFLTLFYLLAVPLAGAPQSGNEGTYLLVNKTLIEGVAWFTINYRLAPKHHYPAPIDDVHSAIRWVKAHAREFNIDPNRLALVGESAGGQIVEQAAVLAKEDTRVSAVVPFYAPVDFIADMERRGGLSARMRGLFDRTDPQADEATLQLLLEASPINHVRAGLPPFLLVHGTGDMSVLYNWSPQFQAKLKAAGVPCDLITIPDGVHGMARWESIAPDYKNKVVDWLTQKLTMKQSAP